MLGIDMGLRRRRGVGWIIRFYLGCWRRLCRWLVDAGLDWGWVGCVGFVNVWMDTFGEQKPLSVWMRKQ